MTLDRYRLRRLDAVEGPSNGRQNVMRDQSGQRSEITPDADARAGRGRRRFGRRALMLGAAATGAGVAASLAGGTAEAAPDSSGAVLLGKDNSTRSTTQVITRGGSGLKGQTYASGQSGVVGFDTSTEKGGHGVYGRSIHGFGILGISEHSTGIVGQNTTPGQSGVAGIDLAPGKGGSGLFGQSHGGDAILATSENGNALHCTSQHGTALLVEGKAKFSYSGVTSVPRGHKTVTVTHGGVTSSSIVIATIQKPQSGISIEGAEPGAGSFTITLTGSPSASVPVGWIILG
jgi:hypothetical protein